MSAGSCGKPYGRGIAFSVLTVDCTVQNEDTPLQQIEAYLNHFSNTGRSIHRAPILAELRLFSIVITRRMIALLLPLLVCADVEEASPHCGSNTRIPVIFCSVTIGISARFFTPGDVTTPEQTMDVCTREDKVSFLAALARGPTDLSIVLNSREILSNLLQIPEIHFNAKRLEITQTRPFGGVEYLRLTAMIQRSVQIVDLTLRLHLVNAPREFYDTLANMTRLQKLSVRHFGIPLSKREYDVILSNLIVGEDGNGAVENLLRNSQNQLTHLDLPRLQLQDHHIMMLAPILRSSNVQRINLSSNNIKLPGLLEFLRQLPNMRSLSSMKINCNTFWGPSVEAREECGAAFLHGLMDNPSIMHADSLDDFPQQVLLWHYYTLNRAGRKLLTSDCPPIPFGLWPILLARAGNMIPDKGVCWIHVCCASTRKYLYNGPANAVFFFLQTFPTLYSYCVSNGNTCGHTDDPSNHVDNSNMSVVKEKSRNQNGYKRVNTTSRRSTGRKRRLEVELCSSCHQTRGMRSKTRRGIAFGR